MCLNPSKISDVGFVACRECWQCRETKVDDWVGRNIAESKTAKAAHVVTLTYGQDQTTGDIDHIKAAVLTYSDVQKYLKYLRADGFPVRYFVVGEYGSLKGRAHWHIILYWQGPVPDHVIRENFMQKHWPHGWSYWDKCSPEAIRYACKYLLKDPADPEKQGWGPMPSKKPPLGHEYFKRLADRYIEQGLSPQSLFYSFPEVRRIPRGWATATKSALENSKRPVQFRMHGKTVEDFLSYFAVRWRLVHDSDPPKSEVLWDFEGLQGDRNRRARATERYTKGPTPEQLPFEGATLHFCKQLKRYYADARDLRLYYSTDLDGENGWHVRAEPVKHNTEVIEQKLLQRGFTPLVLKAPSRVKLLKARGLWN